MKFKDKWVLITGGSSGIGLAVAKLFAKEGANLLLLARDVGHLKNAEENVAANKIDPDQKVLTYSVDVSQQAAVEEAIEQIETQFGTPDYLINSAGMTHPGYFHELDLDIFRLMMEVNYLGTVYLTHAVVPGMIKRRAGHIVNISSIAGFLGVFGYTAYGASKYAVRGFSDVLRVEMKQYGIHVSVVFPPDTQTPQLDYDNQFKPFETKALEGNSPALLPEEVARVTVNGILKNKYIICPGFQSKLLFWLNGWLGKGAYPVMDFMLRNALKNHKG
jgi:3-dehydrosphinganine reductase